MRPPESLSESITLQFINGFVERELKTAADVMRQRGISQPLLLDIGCGRQPYRQLIESLGFAYCSLDIAARGVPLDMIAAVDDVDIPIRFPGGKYHVMLLTEVLEHVDGQETAWENLRHFAADDGILLITTPFMYPLHEEPWDACRPTIYQIRRFAEKSGFMVGEAQQAGSASDVLGLILANLHPSPDAGVIKRVASRLLWVVCRMMGRLVIRFQLVNAMMTKFYISNLVKCVKHARV